MELLFLSNGSPGSSLSYRFRIEGPLGPFVRNPFSFCILRTYAHPGTLVTNKKMEKEYPGKTVDGDNHEKKKISDNRHN